MIDTTALVVFLSVTVVFLVTPGPAILYIVARSLHQGRTAGVVSTLGISTGTVFHILAATLGLSTILVTSALAFNVVKYAGALYLIYLGIRTLRTSVDVSATETPPSQPLWRVYRQGILVNLLNPKTALFFFAFLPQFVNPTHGPVAPQMLLLGALYVILAIIIDGLYALLAGSMHVWLRQRPIWLRR